MNVYWKSQSFKFLRRQKNENNNYPGWNKQCIEAWKKCQSKFRRTQENGECFEKFDPDLCVVCEIPPLRDAVQNNEKKTNWSTKLISLFITIMLITHRLKFCLSMQTINEQISINLMSIVTIRGLQSFVFWQCPLKTSTWRSFLKNWLLSHLLMTSNCSICPQGLYQNRAIAAKAPLVRFKQNYRYQTFNATKTSTSTFNYDRNCNYSYGNYNNNFRPKSHYVYYPYNNVNAFK